MFGRRYFGARFYGARYFGDGGSAPPAVDGSYNGSRYFGPRYFAPRYFSTVAGSSGGGGDWGLEVPTLGPSLAGTFGASGDFAFVVDDQPFTLTPTGPVTLSASFDASGDFAVAVYTPTITVRLVDAAAGGAALPSLTGIEWAWWDAATKESETWGVPPTASGTAESTDGSGSLVLSGAGSIKTSGQQAFVKLFLDGANPRTFGALLTVD